MPGLARSAGFLLLCIPGVASADELARASVVPPVAASSLQHANFRDAPASAAAHELAEWVLATEDAHGLSFVIVDKIYATVFAFGPSGRLLGASPALLGAARGDASPPGIGDRKLSTITAAERITPAGRFVATLGKNLSGEDVVWVDYAAAFGCHVGHDPMQRKRRLARLATPSPLDNRISYGCINVPKAFYEGVMRPIFVAGPAVVYVLPETTSLAQVFIKPGP
jgi:hypothetical protein